MSGRVLRQRKGVRYAEDTSVDDDILLDGLSSSPLRQRNAIGRRSKRARTDDAAEPARAAATSEQVAVEEEQKEPPSPGPADQPAQLLRDEESKEQSPVDTAPATDDSSQSPARAEEDEEGEEDAEWKEEEEARRGRGAGAKEQPVRDEPIVVDDDEEVNQAFSLPALSQPPPTHRKQRGMLGGTQKKSKLQPAAKSSRTTLLHLAEPPSAPIPPPRPPSTARKPERLPVTVSKEEAILLEDSLDSLPRSRAQPPPASSATTSRPSFSFTLPQSQKRKAASAATHSSSHSSSPAASSASFTTQSEALAAMRAVLGPGLPDSLLHSHLIAANYNCERALADILDSPRSQSLLLNTSSSSRSSSSPSASAFPVSSDSAQPSSDAESADSPSREEDTQHEDDDVDEDEDDALPLSSRARPSTVGRDGDDEGEMTPIPWSRKLLVVLRVEAGCTTDGVRVVCEGDSITFRDQTRDTYHLRQLKQQQMQGSRRHAKALRKELRVERRKEHRILRFVPTSQLNALEIGTLHRSVSDVLVPLFDRKLIDLTAVVASPCPVHFDLLSSIPLMLSVWALPALFSLKREVHVERKGFMGRVVADAADVELNPVDTFLNFLRACHIEPTASSMKEEERKLDAAPAIDFAAARQMEEQAKAVSDDKDADTAAAPMYEEELEAANEEPADASEEKKEDEDKDAVKLSPFQLSALYSSAQAQYANLPSLEPSPRLKASLKFYQKQALYWQVNRERAERDRMNEEGSSGEVRRRHPLWDEYSFVGGERFYVNPFSSQLQLAFPESSGLAMGGILGDEMGLGKTVMMISLMLYNHPNEIERAEQQKKSTAASERKAGDDHTPVGHAKDEQDDGQPLLPLNRCTLIVVPMSLLAQWRDEIQRFSDLRVCVYYADNRGSAQQLRKYDVVITSYGTLAAEAKHFQQQQRAGASASSIRNSSPLFSMRWFRCVLDEAHIIRNRLTEQSKACFLLQAERRWTLTGTPIQNHLDDIFPLLHFLKEDPWSDLGWWRRVIARPFQEQDSRALQRLKAVLQPLLLRRTKAMKNLNGDSILDLPPREEEVLRLNFSDTERDFYTAVFTRSKTQIEGFVREGSILNKYIQVLTLLLRLRQVCDHPFLTLGKDRTESEWESDISRFISRFAARNLSHSVAERGGMSVEYIAEIGQTLKKMRRAQKKTQATLTELIKEEEGKADSQMETDASQPPADTPSPSPLPQAGSAPPHPVSPPADDGEDDDAWNQCPICLSPPQEPVLTECGHVYCRECALELCGVSQRGRCCICRSFFSPLSLMAVPLPAPVISIDFEAEWQHSAKTQRLMEEIDLLRQEDRSIKSLIFSQWTSMLDLVQIPLKRAGYKFLRLDGALSQKAREAVLHQFKTDPSMTLLLISLKAGGVGLNLTSASCVFFLDLWFNPAVEQQAIDRVHRIGQTRTVRVKRFIIVDSVEERILELQQRKLMLAQSVHSTDTSTSKGVDVNLLLQCLK